MDECGVAHGPEVMMSPSLAFHDSLSRNDRPPATLLHQPTPSQKKKPVQRTVHNAIQPASRPDKHVIVMFRRVAAATAAAAAVPGGQAGRVLWSAARPSVASPLRAAAPAVSARGRRQYHEKDRLPMHVVLSVCGRVAKTRKAAEIRLDLSANQQRTLDRPFRTHG